SVGPYTGRHQGKKMSLKQATRAALEIARRRKLQGAPASKSEDTMSLSDRILGEAKAKLGSGSRFKAIEKKAAASGAKNPAAVAAAAGMKAHGKKQMEKWARAGKKSYTESTNLASRILGEAKAKKANKKGWGYSDFQTKIKSGRAWGASTFQTKVHSESVAELYGLVDSLVELRNSICQ